MITNFIATRLLLWRKPHTTFRSCMQHKNIVALKGLCMDPFCMLLELLPLGSLYDYIHDEEKALNWANVLKLALDISRGMRFMHNSNPPLIHRDLKSPNILVSKRRLPTV